MRAQWQAFHLQLTTLIHRKSSEQLWERVRETHPALMPFASIDALIFGQQFSGGDQEQRNQVLRSLITEAQAGGATSPLAATVTILTLWPGLDGVHGRLCHRFHRDRSDIAGEIIGQIGRVIQELDLARVNRVAATLVMNTERDIGRCLLRHRRRQASEVCSDDERTVRLLPLTGQDDNVPASVWHRRLTELIGRDADLFLRIIVLGETQAEAGEALGLSHSAARKRHQRAVAKLQALQKSVRPLSH